MKKTWLMVFVLRIWMGMAFTGSISVSKVIAENHSGNKGLSLDGRTGIKSTSFSVTGHPDLSPATKFIDAKSRNYQEKDRAVIFFPAFNGMRIRIKRRHSVQQKLIK